MGTLRRVQAPALSPTDPAWGGRERQEGATGPLGDIVAHLVATTPLPPATCRRIVEEVVDQLSETAEQLLRRRHREMQAAGLTNAEILPRLAAEVAARPVLAPPLTERQIRRVIYG